MLQRKKAGGEAGGASPPFDLPTEGGAFHRKEPDRKRAFGTLPGKSRRRGRLMPATPSISSDVLRHQPFASGCAWNRAPPPLLIRIKTLFLLSARAALIASRTSPALATVFPATSRMTSPSLKPRSAAALFGSTSVTTTPSLPAPATLLAGATVIPSFGTSVPLVALPLSSSLLSVSALASRVFGNWPSVRFTTLLVPLCRTSSLTEAPGARPPMVRASSRASLTV